MFDLPNGKRVSDIVVASGALAFTGRGWAWEWPLRWLGVIRPEAYTVIVKTLTRRPRRGNLRWLHPWTCVQPIPGGVVNAVGLTNGGIDWWVERCYPIVQRLGYRVIVSIAPEIEKGFDEALRDAQDMASILERHCPDIVAIEYNASCPNTEQTKMEDQVVTLLAAMKDKTGHPIIVKLMEQHRLDLVARLENAGANGFDAINSIAWSQCFPEQISPLQGLGGGGVSGMPIYERALCYVQALRSATNLPIVAGGGVYTPEQALEMRKAADAVSLGTVFLRHPWRVPSIVAALAQTC